MICKLAETSMLLHCGILLIASAPATLIGGLGQLIAVAALSMMASYIWSEELEPVPDLAFQEGDDAQI